MQSAVRGLLHLFQQTIQVEGSRFLVGWELHKRLKLLGGQSLGGVDARDVVNNPIPIGDRTLVNALEGVLLQFEWLGQAQDPQRVHSRPSSL